MQQQLRKLGKNILKKGRGKRIEEQLSDINHGAVKSTYFKASLARRVRSKLFSSVGKEVELIL